MVRLAFVVASVLASVLAFGGCKTENQAFCANPANAGLEGCPGDASNGGACGSNGDCKVSGFPICDTTMNDGTCVQCTSAMHDACSLTTPVCVSDVCSPCTMHSQCPSRACLIDGSCADATLVAYVRPGGGMTMCTDAQPCAKVSDAVKVKSIVKVEGMVMEDKSIVVDGKTLQIVADPSSSRLTRTGGGIILDVKNANADVSVSDLEISGGMNPTLQLSGTGAPKATLARVKINGNQGIAILAMTGALRITQSTVSANAGGGISLTSGAQFEIVNNLITGNGVATGGSATLFGGISLNGTDAGTRRIEFNTIVNNAASMGLVAGVNCQVTQAPITANNIVWDNTSGTGKMEIGGGCSWTYSDIGDQTNTTPPAGTGNLAAYPSFVNPGMNYHLNPDSVAKNAADPGATVTVDLDGTVRPQDGRSDMGAYEFKP
jgi:hypothetical protein